MIKFNIYVVCVVSKNDLNNIFNYETFDNYQCDTYITGPGKLYGLSKSCYFSDTPDKNSTKQTICNITIEEDDMFVFNFPGSKTDPKDIDYKPWIVVKHTELNSSHVKIIV